MGQLDAAEATSFLLYSTSAQTFDQKYSAKLIRISAGIIPNSMHALKTLLHALSSFFVLQSHLKYDAVSVLVAACIPTRLLIHYMTADQCKTWCYAESHHPVEGSTKEASTVPQLISSWLIVTLTLVIVASRPYLLTSHWTRVSSHCAWQHGGGMLDWQLSR